LNHNLSCSEGSNSLQIHLDMRAIFINLELIIPKPPWSFGRHTAGQFTQ
jgi:hypothetical protein